MHLLCFLTISLWLVPVLAATNQTSSSTSSSSSDDCFTKLVKHGKVEYCQALGRRNWNSSADSSIGRRCYAFFDSLECCFQAACTLCARQGVDYMDRIREQLSALEHTLCRNVTDHKIDRKHCPAWTAGFETADTDDSYATDTEVNNFNSALFTVVLVLCALLGLAISCVIWMMTKMWFTPDSSQSTSTIKQTYGPMDFVKKKRTRSKVKGSRPRNSLAKVFAPVTAAANSKSRTVLVNGAAKDRSHRRSQSKLLVNQRATKKPPSTVKSKSRSSSQCKSSSSLVNGGPSKMLSASRTKVARTKLSSFSRAQNKPSTANRSTK